MKCKATAKGTGRPCQLDAVKGAMVCHKHGGRAPQVKAKAAERLAEDSARRAFGRLAEHSRPVGDPLTELTKLAGDVVAWKDFLAGRIETLETLRFEDAKGSEQIRGELTLFGQALDRCNTVLATVARLDIDTRLAAITIEQHAMVLRAVEAALDAAGVPAERRPAAKKAAAGHLRLVEAG